MSGIAHAKSLACRCCGATSGWPRSSPSPAVTAFTALLVSLIFGPGRRRGPDRRHPRAGGPVDAQPEAQPGVRYESSPEEGNGAHPAPRPATLDPNSIKQPPGRRYDGGPEETGVAAAIGSSPMRESWSRD
jgi:hypothetical protein